jgi:hypothetical protein
MNDPATKLPPLNPNEDDYARVADEISFEQLQAANLLARYACRERQLSLALELLRGLRLHHSGCRISTEGMPEGGWVDSRCPTCRKLDASGLLGEIGG